RRAFPKAAITTDIIAGFPTETEEDFEQSLSIIREVGFAQIHAFPYSPREGTNAFKKYKELPAALKKERVEKLLAAGEEARKKYLESFIGEVLTVIPERVDGEMLEGYSENYIRVYVPFENTKKPIQVCVFALHEDGVMGMAE
ncbi:MAG: tRNA (N(6)-L-threonylcarbamoyladenosine(37)-C(2))-methylthiotransferase MtaB, partial [Clostridia bacterium]|nr:tRNA (N(6)-L-threonylcarbamoyladenosine(37)-C(2))-methylthiotransferase MtaB [Clostridia bacterium]